MKFYYEFGGNDDVPGEEYEYEISSWEAIRLFFEDVSGCDNWSKVFDLVDGFIYEDAFLEYYEPDIKEALEDKAYRQWRESKE